MTETVAGHVFTPADLNVAGRRPGISAFMRIRDGAAFLEATIRSHIAHFDEIVAVHNRCTDATPDILADLAAEFGEKLRVVHYADPVHPPGSDGHAETAPDDPASMVNYSNVAMAQTRFRTVTKLDDDHLALDADLARTVSMLRQQGGAGDTLFGFSGLNVWRGTDQSGPLSVMAVDPVSGGGDIGFFDVREDRVFTHDARFERTPRAGLNRRFCGYLYWHLKYLKPGLGFANYDLEANPDSRFGRKRLRVQASGAVTSLDALARMRAPSPARRIAGLFDDKRRFLVSRDAALGPRFAGLNVEDAVRGSVRPDLAKTILSD
jgi:hypothetical protein